MVFNVWDPKGSSDVKHKRSCCPAANDAATADVWTYHSRKSSGVTKKITDGFVLFKCPSKPSVTVSRTLKLKQLNGMRPLLILLFTPVLLLLWRVKMSLQVSSKVHINELLCSHVNTYQKTNVNVGVRHVCTNPDTRAAH